MQWQAAMWTLRQRNSSALVKPCYRISFVIHTGLGGIAEGWLACSQMFSQVSIVNISFLSRVSIGVEGVEVHFGIRAQCSISLVGQVHLPATQLVPGSHLKSHCPQLSCSTGHLGELNPLPQQLPETHEVQGAGKAAYHVCLEIPAGLACLAEGRLGCTVGQR